MVTEIESDGNTQDKKKLKILFVGGYGRSGSTLLDRALGQVEGVFSAGELRYIWQRSFLENQLCGCGTPFRACMFWGQVTEEAFGSIGAVDFSDIADIQRRVETKMNIPFLANWVRGSAGFQRLTSDYCGILSRVFTAIQKVSGKSTIIDSSKYPPYGFVLNGLKNSRLHVIHLVRDSRAVSHSWQRQRQRPEIHWEVAYMPTYSLFATSLGWSLTNVLVETLGGTTRSYSRISYESLINNPRDVLQRILKNGGIDAEIGNFVEGGKIELRPEHTVAGNPMRFKSGVIPLSPDEEWREKMPRSKRMLSTSLTWPLLLRYGYFS